MTLYPLGWYCKEREGAEREELAVFKCITGLDDKSINAISNQRFRKPIPPLPEFLEWERRRSIKKLQACRPEAVYRARLECFFWGCLVGWRWQQAIPIQLLMILLYISFRQFHRSEMERRLTNI